MAAGAAAYGKGGVLAMVWVVEVRVPRGLPEALGRSPGLAYAPGTGATSAPAIQNQSPMPISRRVRRAAPWLLLPLLFGCKILRDEFISLDVTPAAAAPAPAPLDQRP